VLNAKNYELGWAELEFLYIVWYAYCLKIVDWVRSNFNPYIFLYMLNASGYEMGRRRFQFLYIVGYAFCSKV